MTSFPLVPADRAESRALVRWTVLTGFATGFVWFLPATVLISELGFAASVAFPLLTLTSALASVIQAARLATGECPDGNHPYARKLWAAEWTMAVGGIGPNLVLATFIARTVMAWGLGPMLGFEGFSGYAASAAIASGAGIAASAVVTSLGGLLGLAALVSLPVAWAVGQREAGLGWRHLLKVMLTWYAAQAALAVGSALWLLGLL